MTLRLLAVAVLTAAAVSAPALAQGPALVGTWKTQTKNGVVQIAPCGGAFCGKLVDGDDLRAIPGATDIRNKDTALRTRPLQGLPLLQGFTGGPDKWTGGTVYNPDDGGTYSGAITRIDADHLKLRGCIIYPLCKTETWTRMR